MIVWCHECWEPLDERDYPGHWHTNSYGMPINDSYIYGMATDVGPYSLQDYFYQKPPKIEPRKIGYVLPVSAEYLAMERFDFVDSIKQAPARRRERLAMETYWTEVPEWDNECVERGSE